MAEFEAMNAIKEFGFVIVFCGGAFTLLFFYFKNKIKSEISDSKRLIDLLSENTKENTQKLTLLIESSNNNNNLLTQLLFILSPQTKLQAQNLGKMCFNWAVLRTIEIVHEVKEQNHISDEKNTFNKVDIQVQAMYKYILLTLSTFNYLNKNLNKYLDEEWWRNVSKTVIDEVYNKETKGESERIKKNIKGIFDTLENKFIENLNG
jgi:hypothetical protein